MSFEISNVFVAEDGRYGRFPNIQKTQEELEASGTAHPKIAETLDEVLRLHSEDRDPVKVLRERGRWFIGSFSAYGDPEDEAHVALLHAAVDPNLYNNLPAGTPVPSVEIATWFNEARALDLGFTESEVRSGLLDTALDHRDPEDDRIYGLSIPVDRSTEVFDLNEDTPDKYTVGYRDDSQALKRLPEGMPLALRRLLGTTMEQWHRDIGNGLIRPRY